MGKPGDAGRYRDRPLQHSKRLPHHDLPYHGRVCPGFEGVKIHTALQAGGGDGLRVLTERELTEALLAFIA